VLVPEATVTPAGPPLTNPSGLVITRGGRYLFMAAFNGGGSGTVSSFAIDRSGRPSPLATVDAHGDGSAGAAPAPSGHSLRLHQIAEVLPLRSTLLFRKQIHRISKSPVQSSRSLNVPVPFSSSYHPTTNKVIVTPLKPTTTALMLILRGTVAAANGLTLGANVTQRVQ
jgi:hypothetical protein